MQALTAGSSDSNGCPEDQDIYTLPFSLWRVSFGSLIFYESLRKDPTLLFTGTMIFHFLLLASLIYTGDASTSLVSPAVNPSEALPPSLSSIPYSCASRIVRAGYQIATALDCLNLLTFILATTPNHNQPTEWNGPAHTAYDRSSGTCSLVVNLVTAKSTAVETASFDEVVAAAMRLIEVCVLNSDNRPGEQRAGVATAGASNLLRVIIHGTREVGAGDGETADSGNRTVAVNGSGAVAAGDS